MEGQTELDVEAPLLDRIKVYSEESVPFVGELPTSDEIAREGVKDFKNIVDRLSRQTKELFLSDKDIWRCFTGVSPEVGGCIGCPLERLPVSALGEVESVLAENSDDFVVIRHKDQREIRTTDGVIVSPRLSLFNLKAAERVIKCNFSYFPPEALGNPRQWLREYPEEWFTLRGAQDAKSDIIRIRYGLLSGFPVTSALKFSWYRRAVDRMQRGAPMTREEELFFRDFSMGYLEASEDNLQRMSEIVEKAGSELTTDERQLILQARPLFSGTLNFGFLSFHEEGDPNYVKELKKIYVKSGIEDMVREIHGRKLVNRLRNLITPGQRRRRE